MWTWCAITVPQPYLVARWDDEGDHACSIAATRGDVHGHTDYMINDGVMERGRRNPTKTGKAGKAGKASNDTTTIN